LITAAVALDEGVEDPVPFGMREGRIHADARKAAHQPVEMLAQPERSACVHRHDLVHGITEQECPVERRDARVGERQKLSIQIADRQRH
jgi:hypothetical protein